jgi:hypothetical protein
MQIKSDFPYYESTEKENYARCRKMWESYRADARKIPLQKAQFGKDINEQVVVLFKMNERFGWQFMRTEWFIFYCLRLFSTNLWNEPVRIPSGKYDETLKVERTQQDLINEMAIELGRLPRFHAYYKIIQETQGKQTVLAGKMQTLPLPKETIAKEVDIIALTRNRAHRFCMERDAGSPGEQ